MAAYTLELNKAALVFFPKTNGYQPFVAQVIVKTPGVPTVGEIAAFFLVQHEITVSSPAALA
jgi:hypothetical protein